MFALALAPSDFGHPVVRSFLDRCLAVVSAAEVDERWNSTWKAWKKGSLAALVATKVIANAWAHDSDMDMATVSRAGCELAEAACERRLGWSELAQSTYIRAVQLTMIVNPLAAQTMLGLERDFDRVRTYWLWHVELERLLLADATSPSLLNHFDPYFDHLRDPLFQSPRNDSRGNNIMDNIALVRLRLALIRWIYIERQPIAGNWRNIIAQIGY